MQIILLIEKIQVIGKVFISYGDRGNTKQPVREREANTIAHLDGRCVKVHVTTRSEILNRNTFMLIANPYELILTRTLYHSDRSLEHKVRKR